jgi:hypothetical protein
MDNKKFMKTSKMTKRGNDEHITQAQEDAIITVVTGALDWFRKWSDKRRKKN